MALIRWRLFDTRSLLEEMRYTLIITAYRIYRHWNEKKTIIYPYTPIIMLTGSIGMAVK